MDPSFLARVKALKHEVETCGFTCKEKFTVLSDFKGLIFCDYLETQRNENGENYKDELRAKVKPAILIKRRGLRSKGVLFLQDNVRPEKAVDTLKTIESLI